MELHARLSPSSARWPHCAGSVAAEANYPDVPGEAAIDGTGSHCLLDLCLKTGDPNVQASAYIGKTIGEGHPDKPQGWVVDAERAKRVQVCIDYAMRRIDEIGGAGLESESKSDPGAIFGRTDWWGTADITLTSINSGILEVIDFKDGQGFVEVENNSQLMSYVAGKVFKYLPPDVHIGIFNMFATIRMTIVQPKIQTKPIRFVETNWQKLWPEIEKLAGAAAMTDIPDAPLDAGDWCKWCNHKPDCPEYAAKAGEGLTMMVAGGSGGSLFEQMQSGQLPVDQMTPQQVSGILDAEPMINALISNVKEEAKKRIEGGEQIPGYALGKGKGKNVWNSDQEMVEKKLTGMRFKKIDMYPTSFISPAQALKKADLTDRQKERIQKELIVYVAGKPSLIKANMEQKSAEEMFAGIEDKKADPVKKTKPEPEDFDTLSFC